MKFENDGKLLKFGGFRYRLKKPYDIQTMERYYNLTPNQEKFLIKMLALSEKNEILFIGNRHKKHIKEILKIMLYLETDKKLLNKIGDQYKKINGL